MQFEKFVEKRILAQRVSPVCGEQERVTVSPSGFSSVWEKWGGWGIGAHTGNMKTGKTQAT